jgi:hypothetical protein
MFPAGDTICRVQQRLAHRVAGLTTFVQEQGCVGFRCDGVSAGEVVGIYK